MEDFVTWVDSSKIKKNIMKYRDAMDDFVFSCGARFLGILGLRPSSLIESGIACVIDWTRRA
jgi:hypothetical protein